MPSSDITYKIENSSIWKRFVVRVNHLKKLVGEGVSDNQYISNYNESVDIEPKNESDINSDEESDNDNDPRASPHSQHSSP